MYVIVQVGSQQYRVKEGDRIETQRLDEKEGINITLDQILLFSDGSSVKVGQPYLKGVKVTAKVLSHLLAPKVLSFKFRSRTASKWTRGHRQQLTALNITKISADK